MSHIKKLTIVLNVDRSVYALYTVNGYDALNK